MTKPTLTAITLMLALAPLAALPGQAGTPDAPDLAADCASHAHAAPVPEPASPGLVRVVHAICPGAPIGLQAGSEPCLSREYRSAAWFFPVPYHAVLSTAGAPLHPTGMLLAFNSAGLAWDASTPAPLWAGVTPGGSPGAAGTYDGVNQIAWRHEPNESWLAVTITWYYPQWGVAVESDSIYNLKYRWSLTGEADRFDLESVAAHELGHTFGLDHVPAQPAHECLTMYPYISAGDTTKRSPGLGDVLGINLRYT